MLLVALQKTVADSLNSALDLKFDAIELYFIFFSFGAFLGQSSLNLADTGPSLVLARLGNLRSRRLLLSRKRRLGCFLLLGLIDQLAGQARSAL